MRVLALKPVGAEAVFVPRLAVLHFEQERRAAIPVPHLGGVDAMPAGHFPCPEQIEDRGGMRAALVPWLVAERLAEISDFRMRPELQMGDDLVCRETFRQA